MATLFRATVLSLTEARTESKSHRVPRTSLKTLLKNISIKRVGMPSLEKMKSIKKPKKKRCQLSITEMIVQRRQKQGKRKGIRKRLKFKVIKRMQKKLNLERKRQPSQKN